MNMTTDSESHKVARKPRPATNYGLHGAGYDTGEKLNELIRRHWYGLNYWRRVGRESAVGWRKGLAYDSAAMHRHVLRALCEVRHAGRKGI